MPSYFFKSYYTIHYTWYWNHLYHSSCLITMIPIIRNFEVIVVKGILLARDCLIQPYPYAKAFMHKYIGLPVLHETNRNWAAPPI